VEFMTIIVSYGVHVAKFLTGGLYSSGDTNMEDEDECYLSQLKAMSWHQDVISSC